jgi:hypothetical protein
MYVAGSKGELEAGPIFDPYPSNNAMCTCTGIHIRMVRILSAEDTCGVQFPLLEAVISFNTVQKKKMNRERIKENNIHMMRWTDARHL